MGIARPLPSCRVPLLRVSALALSVAMFGCDFGPAKPLGSGDDLVVDVDASVGPSIPQYDAAAVPDSPFGALDGQYGVLASDAYDPVAACDECACPSGTYCLGTGGAASTSSVPCGNTDGGPPVGVACEPLPGGCTNEPDCVCLLTAAASELSCVPVCAGTMTFTLYCPTQ